MKDIIEGIKVVAILAIVLLAFEYSIILGILSLAAVAIWLYAGAKKKVYIENPQLRPWINLKKFEKNRNK